MNFRPIRFIKKAISFLTYDLWRMTANNISGSLRYLVGTLKALFLSIRFFVEDRMMEHASALTYYTLLAVVPLFALLLGIFKGFDMQNILDEWLTSNETGHNETFRYILSFADNYLEHSKTGIITGIGIILLIWIIYSLLDNIEAVFNQIWNVKKGRTTIRKITDYLCIIIVIPLLVVFSSGLQIFSKTVIAQGYFDPTVSKGLSFLFQWVPYILLIIVFTMVYIVMPNAKVKFKNALIAGTVAGCAFIVFQNLYLSGQIWVTKYNAIYGSFAALPLLLLWVHMSWIICLYGAELSFSAQNMKNYEFEKDTKNISRNYYDFLCCVIASLIYNQFPDKKFSTEEVSSLLHLPSKLTSKIINHLAELDIICETAKGRESEEAYWIPSQSTDSYTVGRLLNDIDNLGTSDFGYDYAQSFPEQWNTLATTKDARNKVGNQTLLRDFQIDIDHLIIRRNNESSTHTAI